MDPLLAVAAQFFKLVPVPSRVAAWLQTVSKDVRKVFVRLSHTLVFALRSRAIKELCALLAVLLSLMTWRTVSVLACSCKLQPQAKRELAALREIREERTRADYASFGVRKFSIARRLCDMANDTQRKPLRLLCLDGGGIRGVISCVILIRICAEFPTFLDQIDLIAGASTGGFVGLALACGHTPEETLRIYQLTAGSIFSNSKRRVLAGAGKLFRAKFGTKGRAEAVKHIFGELRMDSLLKHVVIPTLSVNLQEAHYQPCVVTNLPEVSSSTLPRVESKVMADLVSALKTTVRDERDNMLLTDVVQQTCSAPTFFPSHLGHVDGGMFANNPSLLAVTKACEAGAAQPCDLVVLSLSTGDTDTRVEALQEGEGMHTQQDVDWGLAQWAPHLIHLLMQSADKTTDLAVQTLVGDNYHRFDPPAPHAFQMDRTDLINDMIAYAQDLDLDPTLQWIARNWMWDGEGARNSV